MVKNYRISIQNQRYMLSKSYSKLELNIIKCSSTTNSGASNNQSLLERHKLINYETWQLLVSCYFQGATNDRYIELCYVKLLQWQILLNIDSFKYVNLNSANLPTNLSCIKACRVCDCNCCNLVAFMCMV